MSASRDARRDLERATTSGLLAAGHALAEATRRDIPVGDPEEDPDPDFALREHVRVDVEEGGRSVVVSVEGPYAVPLHEDLGAEHPRGGQAKFLERNVLALLPRFENIIAAEIRRRLAGGR